MTQLRHQGIKQKVHWTIKLLKNKSVARKIIFELMSMTIALKSYEKQKKDIIKLYCFYERFGFKDISLRMRTLPQINFNAEYSMC